jgi:hypothetical protein
VGLSDGEIFEVIFAMARLMPSQAANAPRLDIPAANLAAAAEIVRGWPASFERQMTGGKAEMAPSKHSLSALLYNSRVSGTLRERMKDIVRASTVQSTLSAHRSIEFSRSPGQFTSTAICESGSSRERLIQTQMNFRTLCC